MDCTTATSRNPVRKDLVVSKRTILIAQSPLPKLAIPSNRTCRTSKVVPCSRQRRPATIPYHLCHCSICIRKIISLVADESVGLTNDVFIKVRTIGAVYLKSAPNSNFLCMHCHLMYLIYFTVYLILRVNIVLNQKIRPSASHQSLQSAGSEQTI